MGRTPWTKAATRWIDDVCLWPEPLRDLVRAFGADSVNDAGLHALGYPAVLASSAVEFEAVRNTFKES